MTQEPLTHPCLVRVPVTCGRWWDSLGLCWASCRIIADKCRISESCVWRKTQIKEISLIMMVWYVLSTYLYCDVKQCLVEYQSLRIWYCLLKRVTKRWHFCLLWLCKMHVWFLRNQKKRKIWEEKKQYTCSSALMFYF